MTVQPMQEGGDISHIGKKSVVCTCFTNIVYCIQQGSWFKSKVSHHSQL